MNKAQALQFRTDIQELLDGYAFKNGFDSVKLGGIKFDENGLSSTIKVIESKAKMPTYVEYAGMLGLPEDIIGQRFTSPKGIVTIIRLDPNKPKNCIILQDEQGTMLKTSAGWYHQAIRLNQMVK